MPQTAESKILRLLARNGVSKKHIWNEEVLSERLPEREFDLYCKYRNERDEEVENLFNDDVKLLSKYNGIFRALGLDEQDSLTAAKKALERKVFISIYDFLDENYSGCKSNIYEFRKHMWRNPHLIYPLRVAKSNNLKMFLKTIEFVPR
jgi:hypothetical protein